MVLSQLTERLQRLPSEETYVSNKGDFVGLGLWHSGPGLLGIKRPMAQRRGDKGTKEHARVQDTAWT